MSSRAVIVFLSLILIFHATGQQIPIAPATVYTTPSPCLTPTPEDFSTQPVNPSYTNATVPGNVPPLVRNHQAEYRGRFEPSTLLNLKLVFKIRNYDAFQTCLASIEDPTSPNFRNFLNSTTLQTYLPTPGTKASVESYFQSNGFIVTDGPSPLVVLMTGTAQQGRRCGS